MSLPFDDIQSSLEEIEFLARSPNRIRVLDTLTAEPMKRHEIEAGTGISRATLARILDDFEDRGWVIREGKQYETTPVGNYVAQEFTDVLKRFAPVPGLNEVAQWFPEEGFDFDLGCLAGAEIIRPARSDALAPTTHITRRLRTADRVRVISYSHLSDVMEVCWRATAERTLELESIVDRGVLERIETDPRMLDHAQEMVESGQAKFFWHEGPIPVTVFLIDDVVLLCLSGDEGAPHAVIETSDETVHSWAESIIDTYRCEGEVLDPRLLTE
ncbi:helix-turn-helix transcriptional regulator [Halomarina pelagica]|uniref:helix-turn-helix transcriptional regulator n=1 Tax=Halomarina pelagica TaxID=2961599 RepID=UPI0020C20438|nr:MarR family transcriptional regulator [Halomarina sp. BND7]